jgi:hypothetical protein
MADLIINEMLGRSLPFIQNVEDNSPAAATIQINAWVISAADSLLRDVTDGFIDDFEAIAGVTEATPYTPAVMDETDITILVDDSNDRTDITFVDQTFTAVAAQTAWDDITLSYDFDGSDTDTTTQVMYVQDFVVTPNGGDITVDFPAVTYRVTQV